MNIRDVVITTVVLVVGITIGYQIRQPGPPAGVTAPQPQEPAPGAVAPAPVATAPEPAPDVAAEVPVVAPAPEPVAEVEPAPTAIEAPSDGGFNAPKGDTLEDVVKSMLPNTAHALVGAPLRGDPFTAPVAITLYTDFQCPHCAKLNPDLQTVMAEFSDKVVLAVRHLPMDFHERAKPAAYASIAAQKQGKFFEYHDLVFATPDNLDDATLIAHAESLGLDLERFNQDRAAMVTAAHVEVDLTMAGSLGIVGTPTLLINGKTFVGALPPENLSAAIRNQVGVTIAHAEQKGVDIAVARGAVTEYNIQRIKREDGGNGNLASLRNVPLSDSPGKGSLDPMVALVVFADFECEHCAKMPERFSRLLEAYPDDLRIVFKHNPLGLHPDANLSAQAAVEAQVQGKFWEFHDRLFDNKGKQGRAALESYAAEVGLDLTRFKAALDNGTHKARVQRDIDLAVGVGAAATPALVINGRLLEGARQYDDLATIIEAARTQSQSLIREGKATREGFYDQLRGLIPTGPE